MEIRSSLFAFFIVLFYGGKSVIKHLTKPKVSIIMPAYNAETNIGEAIKSVMNQTYDNWELLITNDCSTDGTLKIIDTFIQIDKRISVNSLKSNSGVAVARNLGIKLANGDYIAFLDSDDYWDKYKLNKQIDFMLENNYVFTYTNFYVVNDEGEKIGKRIAPSEASYHDLLKGNFIGCLSVVLETKLVKDNPMCTVGHEDYLTWLRILRTGVRAHNTNEVMAFYRIGTSSLSSNKLRAAKWQWNIYTKELGINKIRSFHYFLNYLVRGFSKTFFK